MINLRSELTPKALFPGTKYAINLHDKILRSYDHLCEDWSENVIDWDKFSQIVPESSRGFTIITLKLFNGILVFYNELGDDTFIKARDVIASNPINTKKKRNLKWMRKNSKL